MTVIERAARALLASESNGEKLWDDLDVVTRGAFLRDARAVIQAIREPSESMVAAVDGHSYGQPRAVYALEEANGRPAELLPEVWKAMIDAALAESAVP